jgi:hypothetical protein
VSTVTTSLWCCIGSTGMNLSLSDVAGALLWSHPPTTPTQLNNWRWAIRLWCEFQSLQFCNKQFSFDVINECHQKKIKSSNFATSTCSDQSEWVSATEEIKVATLQQAIQLWCHEWVQQKEKKKRCNSVATLQPTLQQAKWSDVIPE